MRNKKIKNSQKKQSSSRNKGNIYVRRILWKLKNWYDDYNKNNFINDVRKNILMIKRMSSKRLKKFYI